VAPNSCWASRLTSVKGSLRINMVPPPVVSTWWSMRDNVFLTRHRHDDKDFVIGKMT
jgi:hypothetical protein